MDIISTNFVQILVICLYISFGNTSKAINAARMKRKSNPCPRDEAWYFKDALSLCCPCSPCPHDSLEPHKSASKECIEFYEAHPSNGKDNDICQVTYDKECYYPHELPLSTASIVEAASTTQLKHIRTPVARTNKTVLLLTTTALPHRPVISEEPNSAFSDAHLTLVVVIACLALVIIGMTIFYCSCGRGMKKLKNFLKECKQKKRKSKKEPVESEESESFPMSSECDKDTSQGVIEEHESCIDEEASLRSDPSSSKEEEILPRVVGASFKNSPPSNQKTEVSLEDSSTGWSGPPSYKSEKNISPAPPSDDSPLKRSLKDAAFCVYQSTIGGSLHINIHPPPSSGVSPAPAPLTNPLTQQHPLQSDPPSSLNKTSTPVEETVPVRGTYWMRNDVPESLRRQGSATGTSVPSSTFLPETDASYTRQRIHCSPFSLRRSPQEHESICCNQTKNLKLTSSESPLRLRDYDDIKIPRDTAATNRVSEMVSQMRTRNPLVLQTPTQVTPLVVDNLDSTGTARCPLSNSYVAKENS